MKRLVGTAAGSLLAIVGLYVVIGERLAGTSTDATINAHVVTLRAPIDGTLSLSIRSIGTHVEESGQVAAIFNARYDTARIRDLERQESAQSNELAFVDARIGAVSEIRTALIRQSQAYQDGRIRQLDAKVADARSALDGAIARQREANSALQRTSNLAGRGLQTVIMLDRAQSMHDVAATDIESATQKLNYLDIERASAKLGVFLGDSYNDTPASSQRLYELDLRISELKAEQRRILAQQETRRGDIAAERVYVNKATSAVLTAPTRSLVWSFAADDSGFVVRGQELIRLVDCSSIIITASVSEGLYNSLMLGSIAQFRLFGDDRIFNARVIRLGGTSAANLYAELAVAPGLEHLKRFDVALSVSGLEGHPDLACAVGRTGRLVFSSGPLALLSNAMTLIGL